ncbi:unnamed protein product [Effrenium voratum]|uniref:Uncharacterized protein n=1 Tax=Effrenium voratum TaxID=2562239 RepID=A0AA36JPW2_9DINO|nr:unnamed protein product [Effrenium voratum]
MASLADQRCFLPLDLAFSFLAWRDLVPASAVSPAFLRAQAGALCCCSLAGPVTALPCSDGALRWLARRAACGVSPGVEFLKISATACRHTDAGALAVSTVCEPLRVLHFHSKVALRESSATLSPRGLQALLGSGRPALLRAVLHGDAVTDAALEILSAGSPLLQALWLSCSAQVSAGAVRKLAISALQLQDLRLDSLRSAFAGDFKEVLAMPRLQCVLVADAVQLPPVLSASDVQRWQAMRRLAILIEAGCPICPSRPLDHWAAEALGQLPCLESLALANVCVGDHLLQALHGSVTLCALSLEGDHGATLPGICGLLRARGRAGAGLLEELQLTAGLTCQVDDAVLLCFVRLGITYLTLEGANISKDGIRRCAGLQALRAKSCGELDLLPPVARLGPPPRKKKPGPFAAKALKAKTDGGLASGWDVRLLGSDQQLCHWWQKGYRYDDMSWYGLEHA